MAPGPAAENARKADSRAVAAISGVLGAENAEIIPGCPGKRRKQAGHWHATGLGGGSSPPESAHRHLNARLPSSK